MSVMTAGASSVAGGVESRPAYAYAAPDAFTASGPPAAGTSLYDIRNFGAVADPGVDNRAAIQAAIDAAHAAGGGLDYVPPGT